MDPIPYNRSLNGQRYLVFVFTPKTVPILVGGVLGLMPISLLYAVIFGVAYTAYQTYLRLGKPPGFDEHLVAGYITPHVLRPAKHSVVETVALERRVSR